MNNFAAFTNYIVAGEVPDGVRPSIMQTLKLIEELFYECDIR